MDIDQNVKNLILKELDKIEKDRNIKILLAVESGSRAWGFPSKDSDYDVRFIFIRPISDYLSINNKKDTLTFPINNDLDIAGWDIKKFLKYILKSNAVMFEWLQSPVIYKTNNIFTEKIMNISKSYFIPRAALFHYLGITNKFLISLNADNKIKIKKIFYILRPLFAALWIIRKKEIPPMIFQDLIKIIDSQNILNIIEDLLIQKEQSNENTIFKLDKLLINFIYQAIKECEEEKDIFTEDKKSAQDLDYLFLDLLNS